MSWTDSSYNIRADSTGEMTTRSRDSYSSEFRASLVETDSQKADRQSKRRISIKMSTLRFKNVGFYGRDKELNQLQACMDRLQAPTEQETEEEAEQAVAHEAEQTSDQEAKPKTEQEASDSKRKEAKNMTELVLISGNSGTGKTALVKQLRKRLPPGASLAVGKCDWNAREDPYSSMGDLCETLCQKLSKSSSKDGSNHVGDRATDARNLLLEQINGEVMGYLWDLIPSLRQLIMRNNDIGHSTNDSVEKSREMKKIPSTLDISVPATTSSLSAETKRQQMNYAFRALIKVFSSFYQPLVLSFDDIQWSDAATLELIRFLLTDVDHNNPLLIIGSYRSNEVDENISQTLATFRSLPSTVCKVTDIELNNLSVADCNSILGDLLSMPDDDPETTQPLAAICHKRTAGNVHFFLQFIILLYETRLLDFNIGKFEWMWDTERIEAETYAADNVIAVVTRLMAQLSPELQHFLSVASSIGATSTLRILNVAWDTVCSLREPKDADTTADTNVTPLEDYIAEAVNGNFLEPSGIEKYKFVHDKIQEAAGKLIPEDQRKKEQFAIGMRLIKVLSEEEKRAEIFLIRDLLDDTKKDLTEEESGVIVQINLLASERARSFSAFQSSLTYAKKGLSMLNVEKSWIDSYNTTLELHCLACEAAEFTGQSAIMNELGEAVLSRHDCPLMDKLRIYKVKMDRMANDGDPESLSSAVRICVDLLKQMKCKTPIAPLVPLSVISSILRFKWNVPTEGFLRALPKLEDKTKVECMHLLYRLQGYAYFQGDIMLSTWAAFKIAKMTLKYGRHEISCTAFPALAYVMAGLLAEFQKGELYARHGEILSEMERNRSKEGRTMFTTVVAYVYTRPFPQIGKPLLRGYKSSMKAGDTERFVALL